jgi:hypothetical protein
MASVTWQPGSSSSIITTGMNSLANEGNAVSSEINNATNSSLFHDAELYLAAPGSAPSAGAVVELYIIQALDGTNYEDGDASTDPPAVNLVGVFQISASATAQRRTIRGITIPPTKFKYVLINKTGVTLAASGNILKIAPYSYQA